jgi:acetylglutamate kinase
VRRPEPARERRVYKVGGPALEDPGLIGRSAEEVRRAERRSCSCTAAGAQVDRLLKALRHRVALRRRPPRDVARGDGGRGDGALRDVNKELAAGLTRRRTRVGISGRDGGLVRARLEPELGRVGTPERVDPRCSDALWNAGLVPVVSPVASGPLGEAVNVNADEAALGIARAVGAVTLVYLSDVDGVRLGERTAERLAAGGAAQDGRRHDRGRHGAQGPRGARGRAAGSPRW